MRAGFDSRLAHNPLASLVLDHPLGGKRRRAFNATSGADSRLTEALSNPLP
jgi:hypothetical protein